MVFRVSYGEQYHRDERGRPHVDSCRQRSSPLPEKKKQRRELTGQHNERSGAISLSRLSRQDLLRRKALLRNRLFAAPFKQHLDLFFQRTGLFVSGRKKAAAMK